MTKTIDITLAFKVADKRHISDLLISMWTKSKFSHVEVIIDNLWISSTLNGVHIKPLKPLKDEYVYHNLKVSVTEEQYLKNMSWIYSQDKKHYDKTGIILAQLFPFRIDKRDQWFCSEIACKILQIFLVREVIDLYPFLTSPGTLSKLYNLE